MVGIDIPIKPRKGIVMISERGVPIVNQKIQEFGYMMSKFEDINFKRNVSDIVERNNVAMVIEPTDASNVLIGGAGGENGLAGILLAFAGMLMWAMTSVVIRRTCQHYDAIWLTIYATGVAVLCNIPAAGIEIMIKGFHPENFSWMVVVGVLWLGSICTAGANLWWNQALERLPAATCSMFYPVMPFTTAILGMLLLGEKMTMNFIVGALLIIAGMIYTIIGELKTGKCDEVNE